MDGGLQRRGVGAFRLAAVPERAGCADELDAGADAHGMPGEMAAGDRRGQPVDEAGGELFHVGVVRLGHHLFQRGAHGGELQRIGRQRRAHAGIAGGLLFLVGAEAGGDVGAHAPHACRDAAGDRLAEHEKVGVEAVASGVAAEPGRDGVRLVDEEQRSRRAGQAAQAVVVAGIGEHHAGVGQHRFGDDAGDVAVGERGFERREVVELDDLRALGQVAELAGEAGPVGGAAADDAHHRLVDRAVVAAVEDEDLRPAGDGAGDAQREAVGVGRRRGYLPEGQAEGLLEQPSDGDGVLAGQHVGQTAAGLAADGAGHRRRRMAEHRAGVAEAEVGERVTVDVGDRCAARFLDEDREGRRPVVHPVHGNAAVEAVDAAGECPCRLRPGFCEDLGLARPQRGDAFRRNAADAAGLFATGTHDVVSPVRLRLLQITPGRETV